MYVYSTSTFAFNDLLTDNQNQILYIYVDNQIINTLTYVLYSYKF